MDELFITADSAATTGQSQSSKTARLQKRAIKRTQITTQRLNIPPAPRSFPACTAAVLLGGPASFHRDLGRTYASRESLACILGG